MSTLTGPVLAEYQDLFSSSATAGGPGGGLSLGAKAYSGDGREYRFVLAGATTLVVGELQQSCATVTGLNGLSVDAAAIGDTSVTISSSATAAANALAGGYLMVTVTPGNGYQYQIAGNTAVSSAAGMVVTLVDPILVALTTSSKVDLIANPFNGVIVNPTTSTGVPVGVAIYPIVNAQYGWVQVAGPANVLAQGAVSVGVTVVPSTTTAGAVVTQAAGTSSLDTTTVGTALAAITSTDNGPVFLTIS